MEDVEQRGEAVKAMMVVGQGEKNIAVVFDELGDVVERDAEAIGHLA